MSNNQLPGNTPVEIAVNNYLTRLAKQAVNAGGPFDSPRGAPLNSTASSLASFQPLAGQLVIPATSGQPLGYGFGVFSNQIAIAPSPAGRYVFINNTEALLYIGSDSQPASSVFTSPSIVVPPYSRVCDQLAIQSGFTYLAYVPGIDFTTARRTLINQPAAPLDRMSQRVTVIDGANVSPGLMPLRPTLTRLYDTFDFQAGMNNGSPIVLGTGSPPSSFSSPILDFAGFKTISATCKISPALNAANFNLNLLVYDPCNGNSMQVATTQITTLGNGIVSVTATGDAYPWWFLTISVGTPTGSTTLTALQMGGVS